MEVDLDGVRIGSALDGAGLVARLVLDFLTTDPVPTRDPIRRR